MGVGSGNDACNKEKKFGSGSSDTSCSSDLIRLSGKQNVVQNFCLHYEIYKPSYSSSITNISVRFLYEHELHKRLFSNSSVQGVFYWQVTNYISHKSVTFTYDDYSFNTPFAAVNDA